MDIQHYWNSNNSIQNTFTLYVRQHCIAFQLHMCWTNFQSQLVWIQMKSELCMYFLCHLNTKLTANTLPPIGKASIEPQLNVLLHFLLFTMNWLWIILSGFNYANITSIASVQHISKRMSPWNITNSRNKAPLNSGVRCARIETRVRNHHTRNYFISIMSRI